MVDELWVNIGICRTCWFWNLFLLRTFLKQTWPSCLHCRTQSFQIFGFHKYLGNACTNSENPSGYLWQKVHRRCWCWPYRWSQEARICVASSWGHERPPCDSGGIFTTLCSSSLPCPDLKPLEPLDAFCLSHFASAPRILGVGKCKLRNKVLASKLTTCAQSKCCCYEEDSCRLLVLLEVMAWAAFVCIVLIFRPTSAQCFSYGFVFRSPATQGCWKSEEEDVLQRHQDHSKAWWSTNPPSETSSQQKQA